MLNTEAAAAWLSDYAAVINENAAYLTDLDRQIGDADHGSNMSRGMTAVDALNPTEFSDAAAFLKKAGMTLVSTVGGASGPLYGTFLLRFAAAVPGDGEFTPAQAAKAFRAGLDGIIARGKASLGDKTLVDALTPAVEAMDAAAAAGDSTAEALRKGAEAAAAGRDSTFEMVAHKGRASYLGERSKGCLDPGATSLTMLLESAARKLG